MSVCTTTVWLLALSLVVAAGCSRRPARLRPPSINASAAGAAAMEMYDANHDGKLSGAELDNCPALKTAMSKIDASGDGTITAAKITARIEDWQRAKSARIPFSCTVLRRGRPLAGAEVKFVPERFLGDNIRPAAGKTDAKGVAMLSIPLADEKDSPGVAPGFYRVEIAKAGENIPAQYNTNTILGQEVASDAKGVREGVRFDLKY
jgi:hypothetical protein